MLIRRSLTGIELCVVWNALSGGEELTGGICLMLNTVVLKGELRSTTHREWAAHPWDYKVNVPVLTVLFDSLKTWALYSFRNLKAYDSVTIRSSLTMVKLTKKGQWGCYGSVIVVAGRKVILAHSERWDTVDPVLRTMGTRWENSLWRNQSSHTSHKGKFGEANRPISMIFVGIFVRKPRHPEKTHRDTGENMNTSPLTINGAATLPKLMLHSTKISNLRLLKTKQNKLLVAKFKQSPQPRVQRVTSNQRSCSQLCANKAAFQSFKLYKKFSWDQSTYRDISLLICNPS